MQMHGAIDGTSRARDPRHSGYTAGYAAIAVAMCIALLLTLPLAAGPVARVLGAISIMVLTQ